MSCCVSRASAGSIIRLRNNKSVYHTRAFISQYAVQENQSESHRWPFLCFWVGELFITCVKHTCSERITGAVFSPYGGCLFLMHEASMNTAYLTNERSVCALLQDIGQLGCAHILSALRRGLVHPNASDLPHLGFSQQICQCRCHQILFLNGEGDQMETSHL